MRASIRLCLLLVMLGAWGTPGGAAYPDRAIRIVVPFPPGGPVDLVARIVAPKLGERLGQKVDVDNVAGDDGILGTDLVAKAAPDGYTLLLASTVHTIHPGTYGKLPFDTEKAFAPISLLVAAPLILISSPALPVDSVEELVAYAKSHPGSLRYASGGRGGPTQLAFELFKITTGADIINVSFDGGAAALKAVARDKAQVMLAPIIAVLPMIHDGWVRGLAVSGANHAPAAPELPTIAETLAGFTAVSWFGVVAPAGTPSLVITRLSTEFDRIVHEPETEKRFAAIGGEPVGGSPATLAALIRNDIPKWIRVARQAGIRIE
ncbi:MAG: tripartite tricarboxylate transporter substrate binding protein [Alphaproteobacteria bacterium]|nr:MAG: tripartite tricarboxylate transporter substrate binding protein [Alphaproteobacteria bacterium]